jgi:type III pantothenate kinase
MVDTPQELGADRLCNAVAAFAEHGGPCVVVDFGTATTWEVVSAKGEFLGGVIAPGLEISAEALFARAAKLPRIELVPPARVIGKGTIDSMQTGLVLGQADLVAGVTRRVLAELGARGAVVATGGLAPVLAPYAGVFTAVDLDLTLKGLRLLWERNRPTRP